MKKKITLKEALLGVNFQITTLTGEKVVVATKKGQFVSNRETMTIKAKGLPFYEKSAGRGNIFITFEVEYPKESEITPEFEETIDKLLPGQKPTKITEKGDKVAYLEKMKSTDKNTNPRGGSKPFQSQQYHEQEQQNFGGGGANSECNVQ